MPSANGRPTPPASPDPPNPGNTAPIFLAPMYLSGFAKMMQSMTEENKRLKQELEQQIKNRKEAEKEKKAAIQCYNYRMENGQKLGFVEMRKAENKYRRMVEPVRKRILLLQRKKARMEANGVDIPAAAPRPKRSTTQESPARQNPTRPSILSRQPSQRPKRSPAEAIRRLEEERRRQSTSSAAPSTSAASVSSGSCSSSAPPSGDVETSPSKRIHGPAVPLNNNDFGDLPFVFADEVVGAKVDQINDEISDNGDLGSTESDGEDLSDQESDLSSEPVDGVAFDDDEEGFEDEEEEPALFYDEVDEEEELEEFEDEEEEEPEKFNDDGCAEEPTPLNVNEEPEDAADQMGSMNAVPVGVKRARSEEALAEESREPHLKRSKEDEVAPEKIACREEDQDEVAEPEDGILQPPQSEVDERIAEERRKEEEEEREEARGNFKKRFRQTKTGYRRIITYDHVRSQPTYNLNLSTHIHCVQDEAARTVTVIGLQNVARQSFNVKLGGDESNSAQGQSAEEEEDAGSQHSSDEFFDAVESLDDDVLVIDELPESMELEDSASICIKTEPEHPALVESEIVVTGSRGAKLAEKFAKSASGIEARVRVEREIQDLSERTWPEEDDSDVQIDQTITVSPKYALEAKKNKEPFRHFQLALIPGREYRSLDKRYWIGAEIAPSPRVKELNIVHTDRSADGRVVSCVIAIRTHCDQFEEHKNFIHVMTTFLSDSRIPVDDDARPFENSVWKKGDPLEISKEWLYVNLFVDADQTTEDDYLCIRVLSGKEEWSETSLFSRPSAFLEIPIIGEEEPAGHLEEGEPRTVKEEVKGEEDAAAQVVNREETPAADDQDNEVVVQASKEQRVKEDEVTAAEETAHAHPTIVYHEEEQEEPLEPEYSAEDDLMEPPEAEGEEENHMDDGANEPECAWNEIEQKVSEDHESETEEPRAVQDAVTSEEVVAAHPSVVYHQEEQDETECSENVPLEPESAGDDQMEDEEHQMEEAKTPEPDLKEKGENECEPEPEGGMQDEESPAAQIAYQDESQSHSGSEQAEATEPVEEPADQVDDGDREEEGDAVPELSEGAVVESREPEFVANDQINNQERGEDEESAPEPELNEIGAQEPEEVQNLEPEIKEEAELEEDNFIIEYEEQAQTDDEEEALN